MANSEPQQPLNILCLDGGGVRGLSSLLILRSLMQRLQISLRSETELRPCEVFDMICGTSTGGLIALMLGRLRMSAEEAVHSYIDFSRTVFGGRSPKSPLRASSSLLGWFRQEKRDSGPDAESAIYDASKLEKWVEELTAKYVKDGQAPLEDPDDKTNRCCRTFVVAVTQVYADAPPRRFRTYTANGRPADTCRIWEAVRATTAAFPFFKPAKFGVLSQTYIDGSFSGDNNPSRLAVDEIATVFPNREIGCFLSLGTGVPDIISAVGGSEKIAEACMKLIKNCELVHNDVGRSFQQKQEGNNYFRFSVDRGLAKIELDEWNREEELTAITEGYMRYYLQEDGANKCVKTLRGKATEVEAKKEEEVTLQ